MYLLQCFPGKFTSQEENFFKDKYIGNFKGGANNNNNKFRMSIALFPDVIKSALQTFHVKLNTILNGEKVKKIKFKVIR